MKKLMILTALFMSVSCFAKPTIPAPKCEHDYSSGKKKLVYLNVNHFYMDFCVNGLKAYSPMQCNDLLKKMGKEKVIKSRDAFLQKRHQEICHK